MTRQNGFTLVELLLVLTLFSALLLMGYRAIVSAASNNKMVVDYSQREQSLHTGYRTLRNAIGSGASITGNRMAITLDLAHADTNWLADARSLQFRVIDKHTLIASLDGSSQPSVLLQHMDRMQFRYVHRGVVHASWSQSSPPDVVQLSWTHAGTQQQWQFLSR